MRNPLAAALDSLARLVFGISPQEIRFTFDDVRAEIRSLRAETRQELAELRRELQALREGEEGQPADKPAIEA